MSSRLSLPTRSGWSSATCCSTAATISSIDGRSGVQLVLPGAWVDVEAALEAIHRAKWGVARRALASEHNVAEALDVYEQLRVRLRDDLGASPGRVTQELHRSLLA